MNRKHGFTLIELMIVIAIIAVIAAIAIPGLLSSQRASNERSASTSLKSVATAEADFRANDRDWNHVNDFWTGNLSGLYTMTSAAVVGSAGGTTDPVLKLIELSVASADADATTYAAGGENSTLTNYGVYSAKAGYWSCALTVDNSVGGSAEMTYRQDTAGTPVMGTCHNTSRFGFISFPDSPTAGKFIFIINESNSVFRSATSGFSRGTLMPPGLPAAPYNAWPDNPSLTSFWSKLD